VDPGGDTHVANVYGHAERVRRLIKATSIEVIAKVLYHFQTECHLPIVAIVLVKAAIVNGVLAGSEVSQQRLDSRLQLRENGFELRGGHARLEALEEGVIWAIVVAQRLGQFPVEFGVALEGWREA